MSFRSYIECQESNKNKPSKVQNKKFKEKDEQFLQELYQGKTQESILEEVKDFWQGEYNNKEIQEILDNSYILLQQDQNICFYGFGEKQLVVREYFVQKLSNNKTVIEIKCANKSLNPLQLYSIIQTNTALNELKNKNQGQIMESIISYFDLHKEKMNFALILYNLDCFQIYSEEVINFLGKLADMDNINIVATVDSIWFQKCMISWETFNHFSFSFFELSTLQPYTESLDYLDFFLVINQKQKQTENYKGIFESFTESQKSLVFFILKQFYKNEFKPQEEQILWERALYNMKVSSFLQFQENLKEAFNHGIFEADWNQVDKIMYRSQMTVKQFEDLSNTNDFKIYMPEESDEDDFGLV